MKTLAAQDGQSMLDVVLNSYGTLDKVVQLMQDNGVSGVLTKAATAQIFSFDDTQVTNTALRSTFLVNTGPISSLFNSGYGRLVDKNGRALVGNRGGYCVRIKQKVGLSGVDVSSTGTLSDWVASEFITTEFL
jgi:uncharacterized protein (DUF1501 family)